MTTKILLFLLPTLFILSSCGGDGVNTETTDLGTQEGEEIIIESCFSGNSITLNGITIIVADYDTNGDGQLCGAELTTAQETEGALQAERDAAEAAEKLARTVAATIVSDDGDRLGILSASLVGNAEPIDSVAQLHTSLLEGEYEFRYSVSRDLNPEEYIFIKYSTVSAADFIANAEPITEGLMISGSEGGEDVVLECEYKDNFMHSCSLNTSSADIDDSGVFTENPTQAFLLILSCEETASDDVCYSNHATIPVSLN